MSPNRFLAAGATACFAAVVVFATAMGIMQNNDMTAQRRAAADPLPLATMSVAQYMVAQDSISDRQEVEIKGILLHCYAAHQCAVGDQEDTGAGMLVTVDNLPASDRVRAIECMGEGCRVDVQGVANLARVQKNDGSERRLRMFDVHSATWALGKAY